MTSLLLDSNPGYAMGSHPSYSSPYLFRSHVAYTSACQGHQLPGFKIKMKSSLVVEQRGALKVQCRAGCHRQPSQG